MVRPLRRLRRRLRWVLGLALVVLIGWAGAGVASATRSDLRDAEDHVDESWNSMRPALDDRYARLAELEAAVSVVLGPGTEPVASTAVALDDWSQVQAARAPADVGAADLDAAGAGTDAPGDASDAVDAEVVVATRLEGLALRMVAAAGSTDRLLADPTVVAALASFMATSVTQPAAEYNQAVADYDATRRDFPQRTVTGMLGFGPRPTFELPPPPPAPAG